MTEMRRRLIGLVFVAAALVFTLVAPLTMFVIAQVPLLARSGVDSGFSSGFSAGDEVKITFTPDIAQTALLSSMEGTTSVDATATQWAWQGESCFGRDDGVGSEVCVPFTLNEQTPSLKVDYGAWDIIVDGGSVYAWTVTFTSGTTPTINWAQSDASVEKGTPHGFFDNGVVTPPLVFAARGWGSSLGPLDPGFTWTVISFNFIIDESEVEFTPNQPPLSTIEERWDWGDGESTAFAPIQTEITHAYANGTYTVTHTIRYNIGGITGTELSSTASVTVSGPDEVGIDNPSDPLPDVDTNTTDMTNATDANGTYVSPGRPGLEAGAALPIRIVGAFFMGVGIALLASTWEGMPTIRDKKTSIIILGVAVFVAWFLVQNYVVV